MARICPMQPIANSYVPVPQAKRTLLQCGLLQFRSATHFIKLPAPVSFVPNMGSSSSKPEQSSQQHKFSSEHPVRFSEGLVESLQNSPETDSTRAKNLELIIQQRVTAELEKQLAAASENVSTISEKISKEPLPESQQQKPSRNGSGSGSGSGQASSTEKPFFTRISESIFGSKESDSEKNNSALDRHTVSKEVEDLRKKLDERKKKVQFDKEVEKAKEELKICLRTNDRRPLDCWKEVEKFKAEVARLEKEFVHRNSV